MKTLLRNLFCCMAAGLLIFSCNNTSTTDADENTVHTEEPAPAPDTDDVKDQAASDTERVADIYKGSLYEVKLSEMVISRTKNAEVKKLATMMADAHKKMNGDLQKLAGSKSITLAADISDDKKESITKMSDNDNLDEDYLDKIIEKHREAIDKAEHLAEDAQDPEIRAFFSKSVLELKSHLQMAEQLEDKVDGKP